MKNTAFAVITAYRQKVLQENGSQWFHPENESLLGPSLTPSKAMQAPQGI
ncbi:hypothetical protein [Lyngbya confervoides]|uniref:Uncharacterized protein n=1 Tax=Lyngbya confervoides BDU141951 TaxID=1574623 RepID=A0ABD4SZ93_9CYAN|nr:hypothetical protein [Lyngbya confervoides]MCM1981714.1 hypothetical protein [Lyngbya confervoides BDU141951]